MTEAAAEVHARIGANVRRLRIARGLSIVDAAQQVGVSRVHFSNWERAVKPISVDALVSIARLLDVPLTDLLVPPASQDEPVTTIGDTS